jgi:outer membrane receptor protein involved in Fe transport
MRVGRPSCLEQLEMKKNPPRLGAFVALAAVLAARPALAEEVSGTISDSLGKPIPGAGVRLQAADGHVIATTNSNSTGHYEFPNVAVGTYQLSVSKSAFQPATGIVTVAAKTGATAAVTLGSSQALQLEVRAKRLDVERNTISVETGSSSYRMQSKDIQALPLGRSTPLNQVMLQAPGVVQDSFGQVHVRGDHADLQYRLNGIILPESITGFGQTLDTRFAQSVNVLTGALPAQYGYRTAGVVEINTRSGALAQGGRIGLLGGSHDTGEVSADMSGHSDALSYYFTGSYHRDRLGIENPTDSTNALHDRTEQSKGFGYLSYLLGDSARLSFIAGTAHNRFQIPNVPNQTPSYTLSGVSNYPSDSLQESQTEQTDYQVLALQATAGTDVDYQVSVFNRDSKVAFNPDDTGDLIYTGVASKVNRASNANGLQGDGSYRLNDAHTLRSGIFYSREHAVNDSTSLTFPADANGNQTSSTPETITDNSGKNAYLYGVYLQDEWHATKKLTVNYGVRGDRVDAYVTGGQLSPRIGAVYQATPDTTLHAGYARYFTPPPTELIAPTTVAAFDNTTNASPSTQNDPVKPERSDYYDIGVSQNVTSDFTMGLDGYYRRVKNLLDEGQFGSALLFTPFNYADGKIYGAELTANYHHDNLSGYANFARSTALGRNIVSGQYNFDSTELAYIQNNWIHLDHDQTYTASGGLSYLWDGSTYGLDVIYGSGLRNGFANTGHLPGYTQFNASVDRKFDTATWGKYDARFSIINLFDKVYEIRDGTGVGVGAPQYGPRRGFYVSLNKYF